MAKLIASQEKLQSDPHPELRPEWGGGGIEKKRNYESQH
jgi:hypothetical protein